MKNLLIFLILHITYNVFSQTLKTDVRVAQFGEESNVSHLSYEISMTVDTLYFKCINCESTFELILDEFQEKIKIDDYILVTFSTTDLDDIVFVYNPKGNLTAITIKQYNNVSLVYMRSLDKIPNTKREKKYKL